MIFWIILFHFILGAIVYGFMIYDTLQEYGVVTLPDMIALFSLFIGGYISVLIILFTILSNYVNPIPIFKKDRK